MYKDEKINIFLYYFSNHVTQYKDGITRKPTLSVIIAPSGKKHTQHKVLNPKPKSPKT